MADDLVSALRALANRWAMKARDYARAAKEEGATDAQANYNRGFADGYYRAATELAAMVSEQGTARDPQPKPVSSAPSAGASQPRSAAPASGAPQPAAMPPPAPPKPQVVYASISVGEALSKPTRALLSSATANSNRTIILWSSPSRKPHHHD
jgi:hypothetical protein